MRVAMIAVAAALAAVACEKTDTEEAAQGGNADPADAAPPPPDVAPPSLPEERVALGDIMRKPRRQVRSVLGEQPDLSHSTADVYELTDYVTLKVRYPEGGGPSWKVEIHVPGAYWRTDEIREWLGADPKAAELTYRRHDGYYEVEHAQGATEAARADSSAPQATARQPFTSWAGKTFDSRCSLKVRRRSGSDVIVRASVKNRPGTKFNYWNFDSLRFRPDGDGWTCHGPSKGDGECMLTMFHCER